MPHSIETAKVNRKQVERSRERRTRRKTNLVLCDVGVQQEICDSLCFVVCVKLEGCFQRSGRGIRGRLVAKINAKKAD